MNKFKKLILLSITFIALVVAFIYYYGRIELPYYNLTNKYTGSMYMVKTLKESYNYADAAVIVSYVSGPLYYDSNELIEPGSSEEELFKDLNLSYEHKSYEFQVKIIQIVDNKSIAIKENDVITISHGYVDFDIDPFYNQIQINPNQRFLLFISDDFSDEGAFNYSTINQYYIKNNRVYSTNRNDVFNQYSGILSDQLSEKIRN